MKVIEITVSSGRVLPHPHLAYANLRPAVSLRASLDETESVEMAFMALVRQAETMLDLHVNEIRSDLDAKHQAKLDRFEKEYERCNRERSLAAVSDPDELDDEELDDEGVPWDDDKGD